MSSVEEEYLRTAFLKRIAHELRGPAGVVQTALGELEHALGEEGLAHRTLLSSARRGIARLLRLAKRLDHTAEFAGSEAQFHIMPCDLSDLVRRAVADAEALEARRNIAIAVRAPETPLPWDLDATWITVAFFELTSNAIRHAKRRVEVSVASSEDEVTVIFADDNDSAQSFTPARFRPPQQRRGLGLGLAIAQDVVLAHHGRLDIQVDTGAELRTRVGVTLLKKKAPGADLEAAPAEPAPS